MTIKSAKNSINKTFVTETIETNDGSGDLIVILPEEIIKYNNWKEGQAIEMEVKDGKIYLTALPK